MALGKAIASGATAAALTSNPIGWAVGGAMLASSLFGGKAKKEAAGKKMGYIQEQMSGFQDQLASIPGLVTDKTKMALDAYGLNIGKAMSSVGQSLFDITKSAGSAITKSGFAASGQISSMISRGEQDTISAFDFTRTGLQNQLGEQFFDIAQWQGAEEGRIGSELTRLQYEFDQAKAEADKGVLERIFTG